MARGQHAELSSKKSAWPLKCDLQITRRKASSNTARKAFFKIITWLFGNTLQYSSATHI